MSQLCFWRAVSCLWKCVVCVELGGAGGGEDVLMDWAVPSMFLAFLFLVHHPIKMG